MHRFLKTLACVSLGAWVAGPTPPASAAGTGLVRIAPVAETEGSSAFVEMTCPTSVDRCEGSIGFPHRRPSEFALVSGQDRRVAVRIPVRYLDQLRKGERVRVSLQLRGTGVRESVRVRLTYGRYRRP